MVVFYQPSSTISFIQYQHILSKMIISNRTWNVNLTKERLLKEIDDEIQKEYQILNKFSSEKFSILLVIIGAITILVTIQSDISTIIYTNHLLVFYVISANLLILYWCYSEKIEKLMKFFFQKKPIILEIQKNQNSGSVIFFRWFDINERDQFKILLNTDWEIAKKGEPYFKAFLFFFSVLIGICYISIQEWVTIPHLNDTIIFGIPLSIGIILYSFVIILGTYNPDIMTLFYEWLFEFLNRTNNAGRNQNRIAVGIRLVSFGFLLLIVWNFFFYFFPILIFWYFVIPNSSLILSNLLNSVLILVAFTAVLYFIVDFIAILFCINLVENIKNEKIWWLETLKMDLNSITLDGAEKHLIEEYYKKFDFSDLYIPVPIHRFLTFQKYVLIPKWVIRPAIDIGTIDIGTCEGEDFKILKERFTFHRNLMYRQKAN